MKTKIYSGADLGDGLVVRWSTAADTEGVAELFGHVFREKPDSPINTTVKHWIRDEMGGRHPLVGPNDTALVEDTKRGTIVSASVYVRQHWQYAGIPFDLGRTEPVATHEDYRGRGLVRATFDLCHQRSDERGDLAQCITGIEYFYRQFGYEYAIELGGSRTVYLASLPKLKEGESETFRLRQAGLPDIAQLAMLYERERSMPRAGQPPLVTAPIDSQYWQWLLAGMNHESNEGWRPVMIERAEDGQTVGYVWTSWRRWNGSRLPVLGLATEPNVPMTVVMPSVLRGLAALMPEIPLTENGTAADPARLVFVLGKDHPAYDALGPDLAVKVDPPYAWYVRVPDLPRFLRHIAPALEKRLSSSALAGYSGEHLIDFYRGGMRLAFEKGRLTVAEPWQRPLWGDDRAAGFPPLVFLQLLFGRRSLAELRYAFPDVWANDTTTMLLETLFPPQPSWIANLV
jgi:hypothetical protein